MKKSDNGGGMVIYSKEMKIGQFPCKCALMRGSQPFVNHCHSELEIIKIRHGYLKVSSVGESFLLSPGDIWIVPPFLSHSIDEGTSDCLRLAILIEPGLMGLHENENISDQWMNTGIILEQRKLYSAHWDEALRKQCDAVVEKLYDEYAKKQDAWQLAVQVYANQLLLLAIRQMPKCQKKLENKKILKIKTILEYIAMNYCTDIRLEACAATVGFNPTYLSRYFKQHMGITFQEYVKQLRIERAAWLLRTEKMSVTEVAFCSGFNDIKTFNKLFKKEVGKSPSRYKKENGIM